MQIEIKDTEYEISTPKKSFLTRYLELIHPFIENYGGWKLVAAISAIAFIAAYFLPGVPSQALSTDEKITIWGTNFYHFINASGTYYRWITANFLHFGFLHIAFNLFAAYMLGTFLEKIWNAKIFFVLFLLSGFLANIGTYYINHGNSAGASGGIFGLMGGLLAYFLWSKDLDASARLFMLRQIGVLLLINVVLGLVIPNIDLVGHLSGFVAGLLIGKFLTIVNLKKHPNLLIILWVISLSVVIFSFTKATLDYFKAISF